VDAPAWVSVQRRFHELYKPGDAAIVADARSLFSLFFAANYQRAMSRSPEKEREVPMPWEASGGGGQLA
jgi:hypothetical protein